MGYISVDIATKLVKDHLVDEIELNESQDTLKEMYKLCLYGKMTQKPISKVLEMEASRKTEDEIHTNVQGPAPIETPQHKSVTVVLWTSSHILYGLPLHQKGDVSKATC